MSSNEKLSDREKELIEVIQLAYQKFCLNDIHLSRAMVENIMTKVIKNTIGDEAFRIWVNSTKAKVRRLNR